MGQLTAVHVWGLILLNSIGPERELAFEHDPSGPARGHAFRIMLLPALSSSVWLAAHDQREVTTTEVPTDTR